MKRNLYTALAILIVFMVLAARALVSFSSIRVSRDPMDHIPHIVLWAWEERGKLDFIEKLDFIDPDKTAVAYLAGTLDLAGDSVLVRPRFQPLTVPPHTTLIAVVRIEDDRRLPPSLSPAQIAATARIIPKFVRSSTAAIQIDFDARRSERAFYRDLLIDLRHRLPAAMPLSMTALASWCLNDDWITSLPVDEAVPMLYRMGPDSKEITAYLRGGGAFVPPVSRNSVGLSLDEPFADVSAHKRVYLFSPKPWTVAAVRGAVAQFPR